MKDATKSQLVGSLSAECGSSSTAEVSREAPSSHQNAYPVIETLDRIGCIAEWKRLIGSRAPKHVSVTFMRKALAYERQCQLSGGLPSSAKRALAAVAKGKHVETSIHPSLQPGTHLMREWNGRTYQVEVVDGGFLLDGMKYRSLSAVAKKITGAHWSGPRFFGINS